MAGVVRMAVGEGYVCHWLPWDEDGRARTTGKGGGGTDDETLGEGGGCRER